MNLVVRKVVGEVLDSIFINQAYANIALDKTFKKNDKSRELSEAYKGVITQIIYGTVTYQVRIDNIIKFVSDKEINKIDSSVLNVLRSSIYQLIYLDNVNKIKVVNETTEYVKSSFNVGASKFTNAILRRLLDGRYDEFCKTEEQLGIINKAGYISSITSHPLWLVKKLLEEYETDFVFNILLSNNQNKGTVIRINKLKTNIDFVKEELNKLEIDFDNSILKDFLVIKKGNIVNTNLFKEGYITIQDVATGIASLCLNVEDNEKVMDACSSPGGKTAYISTIMKNTGNIVACDVHEHRIKLVEETCNRLGVLNVEVIMQDAIKYNDRYDECFDKILLDVPCSGLGVISKKVDIKQKRKLKDIEELSKIQFDILDNVSKYVKIGGRIVYSTCTIIHEENENVIEKFILDEDNKDNDMIRRKFKIIDPKKELEKLEINVKGIIDNKHIKLYPHISNTDGFFICILERVE